MSAAKKIAIALFSFGVLLVPAAQASAAAAPAWQVSLIPMPTNLQPDTTGNNSTNIEAPIYRLLATNIGAKETGGPVTFTATLPADVTPIGSEVTGDDNDQKSPDPVCSTAGQEVTCTTPGPVYPSRWTGAIIPVEVSPTASGVLIAEATISGGGAQPVSSTAPTEIKPHSSRLRLPAGSRWTGKPAHQRRRHRLDTGGSPPQPADDQPQLPDRTLRSGPDEKRRARARCDHQPAARPDRQPQRYP